MKSHFSAAFLAVLLLRPALAAPPTITRITTPGLQSGAAASLIIDGTDLLPNPRLILPIPLTAQTVKPGATPQRVQIDVKLADNVPPGLYQVRLANDKGISAPIGIESDDLLLQPFGPKVDQLPCSLAGTLSGSTTLSTTVTGKKGQRLTLEVEARRLHSVIDPVVKLLDPRRVQLAYAHGSSPLQGDCRLTAVLPEDGVYTIELHDAAYRAGTPGRFRLRLGDLKHADLAFPLAGQRGQKASFQLIGTVAENSRVEADLTSASPGSYVRLPRLPGQSGSAPLILVSDLPEVVEAEQAKGKAQDVTLPAGINGRLRADGEEDLYRLTVQPGMKLRFDLLAERAGSALDGVLNLRNDSGATLVRSDDQPNTLDPGLEYTVPPGVTALVAAVSDLHGRGGPTFVYRLAVVPSNRPDFNLTMSEDRLQLPRDGAAILKVRATRSNYDGPIKLTFPGLPEGVSVTGDQIAAGAGETLVTLTAKNGAKLTQGVLPQLIGDSTDPKTPLRRLALTPEPPPPTRPAPVWLRQELAVALTEPQPLGIVWEALDPRLPIGGKATAKVKLNRNAEVKGTLRVSLVTSQVVPKGRDMRTDDVNRAIRLETVPMIAAGQTALELKLLVPADLPVMEYDVAIRIEALGADNRTVVLSAVTPARRLAASK